MGRIVEKLNLTRKKKRSRLYARALKGKRAVGDRPDGRGKNLTLVGAMALRGLVVLPVK
jgi:hypothetical protein